MIKKTRNLTGIDAENDLRYGFDFLIRQTESDIIKSLQDDYDINLEKCHAYGLCVTGETYTFPCKLCPGKG